MSSILIDPRGGAASPKPGEEDVPTKMVRLINQIGVRAELGHLEYGDACFEGNGPEGRIGIGIERKTLHDLLNCIDDSRLAGHQLIGMRQMYQVRVVLLEGHWRPHDPEGWLMEGFNAGTSWGHCRYRQQRTLYSKVYRYLISLSMSGVHVTHSRDLWQTCYNITEWFHYFQKKWDAHQSMMEIQKVAIPALHFHPSLTRLWANDIQAVGLTLSERAERHFKTPLKLANSEERDWLKIPGIGVKKARDIIREIWTGKR